VVAGNPKVYGQLVQILSQYTRVIKPGDKDAAIGVPGDAAAPGAPHVDRSGATSRATADATQAFVDAAAPPAVAGAMATVPKRISRIRKTDSAANPAGDDAPM